mmetsp:Transcript_21852/g.22216  ORF Transcript_21852/g.22216 Transcript_21852/m.22216 type:complete len:114 (+) Transcript_21852:571-912(+)
MNLYHQGYYCKGVYKMCPFYMFMLELRSFSTENKYLIVAYFRRSSCHAECLNRFLGSTFKSLLNIANEKKFYQKSRSINDATRVKERAFWNPIVSFVSCKYSVMLQFFVCCNN